MKKIIFSTSFEKDFYSASSNKKGWYYMKNVIIYCWIFVVFSFNEYMCVYVCVCLEEYEIKNRMTLYDIVCRPMASFI